MQGNKVDIIVVIMDQLADLRENLEMNLYFALCTIHHVTHQGENQIQGNL